MAEQSAAFGSNRARGRNSATAKTVRNCGVPTRELLAKRGEKQENQYPHMVRKNYHVVGASLKMCR